ncbi:MAG: Eco57I restriction-modification methylase domain-containing protein, partial [Candidatus Sericytochromatia bacterium]|nr:Eco57I restriction-modification methylase domain-containing protein [Candidatus Sericytochromatia bacterium]
AAEILRAWCALRVVDPAMSAGDWLCGRVLLHRRMGTALADRCGAPGPDPGVTAATVHGVDLDPVAVALAEVRLTLLTGAIPDSGRLIVGNSLLANDGDEPRRWHWPGWPQRFDVVLGNPPFVSTKQLDATGDRQRLLRHYGYADDLYVHFVDQALHCLKPDGWLLYILSDSFRTTITKNRLRERLLACRLHRLETLADGTFAATVGTVVVTLQLASPQSHVQVPPHGTLPLRDLILGPRRVFVDPTPGNQRWLARLRPHWEPLLDAWAEPLRDSRRQQQAASAIETHRLGLRPGDWTLLGLLCDGGVGLQTGDNGLSLGIRAGSPAAKAAVVRLATLRQEWLADPEVAVWIDRTLPTEVLAVALRSRFSAARLGFRRGEVWRVVALTDIADPMAWPEAWRQSGTPQVPAWVPYEKGDPEGRRWLHDNPFLIRWDKAGVRRLRDSGRGRGEPVLRNPQFFFQAGVTWSNMSSQSLKARLQPPCVFDVGSMTLFPRVVWLDPLVLVTWLNAASTTGLLKAFINHTLNFQINDLRLLPLPVPSAATCAVLRDLAQAAVDRGPAGETADLERLIDDVVAASYGSGWDVTEMTTPNVKVVR